MQLEAIIGLEIHAQIATKTKMFCDCDNDAFGRAPNSCVCPVCVGHPGALPVPNATAVELGVKAALALGCTMPPHAKFDRKNYFYPDLPAGYQISQFDEPVSVNGAVEIRVVDPSTGEVRLAKKVRITRLHLENDAGKLTHVGSHSLCDYNRAGTPLMEIVSEPELRSAAEARAYAEEVQRIVQFVGASNADMFKGEMRFDASVSLRPVGESTLYPRAEIKNLNSFKALEAAVDYEIRRQTQLWEAGTPPASQQTVGWNDERGETYLLREKESAADYRYFPEPDIPPLTFTPEQIAAWRAELPELPLARRQRFVQQFALSESEAGTLTATRELADYFEAAATAGGDGKKAANWILTELLARLNAEGLSLSAQKITAGCLGELVALVSSGEISGKIGKVVFPEMWATGESPRAIVERKGLKQVSDTGAVSAFVDEVLAANEKVVADFRGGNANALGFLVGQVMKISKGQANPALVNQLLKEKLG